MDTLTELTEKFRSVWPLLDERTRRIMAASEARALGHGGVSLVRRACGLSRKAIAKGIREIEEGFVPMEGRIRRPGAGGKPLTVSDPGLVEQLEEMIEVQTRGDPESPLRWICKSTRAIAKELARHKHPVSHTKVAQILHDLDYSLQSNRKTEEGKDHPDRDAQFRHISATVRHCLRKGSPVISVDTKKKELIGNYDNAGQQWLPAGQPIKVQGHDFPTPDVPRAYPYGVYDIGRNTGFVIGNYDNAGQQWLPAGQPIKVQGHDFPTPEWRGEPRHRSRHGSVCGRLHSRLVAPGRETDLSECKNDTDHRRRRREQRLAVAPLEI